METKQTHGDFCLVSANLGSPADLECHDIVLKGIVWIFFFLLPPLQRMLTLQQTFSEDHFEQELSSDRIYNFCIFVSAVNSFKGTVFCICLMCYAFHMESAVLSYCMAKLCLSLQ